MIPKNGISLQYLKDALLRRLWYVVFPFFIVSMATVTHCIKLPKLYRSSTLILVQPPEVPSEYVRPTVTSNARARLDTLKEEVMSRPKLERIIEDHSLYPEVLAQGNLSDAVEMIRKQTNILIKDSQKTGGTASFEVSYLGYTPETARDVTAAIANLFIEDNLKLREEQALNTSKFIELELARIREDLRQKEELVRQFKEKHMGNLPEQRDNNYRILDQLQQEMDSLNATIQQTEDRKILLQSQLARLQSTRDARIFDSAAVDNQRPLSLEELRQQLKSLRSRYSDRHPDVIRVKMTIARLEKELVSTNHETNPQGQTVSSSVSGPGDFTRTQTEDLLTQLKLVQKEILTLNRDKEKIQKQIKEYRQRIESGPKTEQMFVDLRRDYEQANQNYQTLLVKKMEADLAANLERTQKGEQFIIAEPANLPQKPFGQNIPRKLAIGFMFALTCGCGVAYFKENTDQTFQSSRELESALELSVLVSVPVIKIKKEKRVNLLKRIATAGVMLSMALTLLYALLILWQKHPSLLTL